VATPKRKNQQRRKLEASVAGTATHVVPTRWVKFVVGLFLLPVAWILTQTFFGIFAWITVTRDFWATAEFWFFAIGCVAWGVVYVFCPRPMLIYVFGHELTHAIWVWIMGGRVSQFRVSRQGGHILADKVNTWIALAPYFFPIYSLLLIAGYVVAAQFTDMTPYQNWLFAGLGFTWAFHFTFTCLMIPKGQPDLEYGGQFFSLVVIYIANLLVLSLMLVFGADDVTWRGFGEELVNNAADFAHLVLQLAQTQF